MSREVLLVLNAFVDRDEDIEVARDASQQSAVRVAAQARISDRQYDSVAAEVTFQASRNASSSRMRNQQVLRLFECSDRPVAAYARKILEEISQRVIVLDVIE